MSQLSEEQRYQIAALLQNNIPICEIAKTINVHKSTIYREIKRNSSKRKYVPKIAQENCDIRKERLRRPRKFSNQMYCCPLKFEIA